MKGDVLLLFKVNKHYYTKRHKKKEDDEKELIL